MVRDGFMNGWGCNSHENSGGDKIGAGCRHDSALSYQQRIQTEKARRSTEARKGAKSESNDSLMSQIVEKNLHHLDSAKLQ